MDGQLAKNAKNSAAGKKRLFSDPAFFRRLPHILNRRGPAQKRRGRKKRNTAERKKNMDAEKERQSESEPEERRDGDLDDWLFGTAETTPSER